MENKNLQIVKKTIEEKISELKKDLFIGMPSELAFTIGGQVTGLYYALGTVESALRDFEEKEEK